MQAFRQKFPYLSHINWYPGHMATAKKQILQQLANVDIVVEVRDARLPFSTANPLLDEICRYKQRLIVFNKADLANPNMQARVQHHLQQQADIPCLFTSKDKTSSMQAIQKWCQQNSTSQFQTTGGKRIDDTNADAAGVNVSTDDVNDMLVVGTIILIAGLPNVGKSSIINSLRKLSSSTKLAHGRKAAAVGDTPGLTRRTDLIRV